MDMRRPANEADIAKIKAVSGKFTEKEIEKIMSLPVRKVKFSGEVKSALYDEKSYALYLLGDDGVPTGEVRVLSEPLVPRPNVGIKDRTRVVAQAKTDELQNAESATKAKDVLSKISKQFSKMKKREDIEERNAERNKDEESVLWISLTKKNGLLVAIFFSATVSALMTLMIVHLYYSSGFRQMDSTPSAAEETVYVVQMTADIVPGEQITEDMLTKISVSSELYNQVSLTGNSIYIWDRVEFLEGMYATNYVATGQFLTHDDVVAEYRKESNPFLSPSENENEYQYLSIPVNLAPESLDEITLGRMVNITIEVNTQVTRPESVATPDVPGLNHSSSITEQTLTDIYKLNSTPILDLVAADGTNIFDLFSSLNAIPDGDLELYMEKKISALKNQIKNGDSFDSVMSKYRIAQVWIKLPSEQVEAIGTLDSERTKVSIVPCFDGNEPAYFAQTDEQKAFVSDSKFTAQVVADAIELCR